MPEYGHTWQAVVLPSKKKKNLVSSVVTQIILILACGCRGMLSQKASSYRLTVSSLVTVRQNSCVHIPCQFTYHYKDISRNEKLSAYWFKVQEGIRTCFGYRACISGSLVATTDGRKTIVRSAMNRFHLIGDPNQGNCSLIIMDAQAEDEGYYYLRIEGDNKFGYSYFPAGGYTSPYIYVTDQPQNVQITWIIETLEGFPFQQGTLGPVVAQEGDTVKLRCVADGKEDPILTWTKGNNSNDILKQGREHAISQIKPEDAGEYQCQAKNMLGSASKTIFVIVQYQPKTVTFNISNISRRGPILSRGFPQELLSGSQLMAQEGESLQLQCKADSNPPVSTHWNKPGEKTLMKYADNSVELTELTVEDEGEYVCRVENTLGSAQGTFQLYVAYAPKLSEDPQRNTTCWHQDNGFLCNCSLKAQPPPQIQWQVDGETITERNHKRNLEVTSLVQGNEVTSTLNWTGSLQVNHTIICTGNNSFGIYRMQLLISALRDSSATGRHTTVLISGLCGALLGASFFMLGLFLLKFYKQKALPAPPKAGCDEVVDSTNAEYPKSNSNSLIYSNIFPVGPRTPYVGQPKTARQNNVKQGQIPKIPDLTTNEVDELHYAALEFKLKNTGTSIAEEESVEYSAIRQK